MSKKIFVAKRYIPFNDEDSFFNTKEAYALFEIIQNDFFVNKYIGEDENILIEISKETLIKNKDYIKKKYLEILNSKQNNEIDDFNINHFEEFYDFIENKKEDYILLELA